MKDNNYYERNELIPNVQKFAKKLQITIHPIGAIEIEKSPKKVSCLLREISTCKKEAEDTRWVIASIDVKQRSSSVGYF